MKMPTATASATPTQPDSHVFDRWAEVYDSQSNPLLMLEERNMLPLLPLLSGSDVLDAGCGTGRWLRKLEALRPASLTGTDCSAAMLERARAKVLPTTKLELGECSTLPGQDASKGFVLASFVLSYLDDLETFARECARVLRTGGSLLVSDMHPTTAARRGWKRSFSVDGARIEIATYSRPLTEIISVFQRWGFELQTFLEPSFATPEQLIFENAGKLAEYEDLVGVAAVYILKFRRQQLPSLPASPRKGAPLRLTYACMADGPDSWKNGTISIEAGRITSLTNETSTTALTLDLSGYVVLPGLINAHEHLEFGLFPRLGRDPGAPFYKNSAEWAQEIHQVHAATIERYRQIPQETHLWWAAIRNLLCGVTTISHHNPLHPELALPDFPVHIVSRFGWSHSLSFDPHLAERFRDTPRDYPFILHAAEGLDDESLNEISRLDQLQVLDERTILVHGLACTSDEIALLNRRGTSLITCPISNQFLFGKTLANDLLTSVERLALGSDSPITAAGDLLDEIRYLKDEAGLDPNILYNMTTSNPAKILQLSEGQGQIEECGIADLIAVRDQHVPPALALSRLHFTDVELVVVSGRVQVAAQPIYARLPPELRTGMQRIEVGGQQRWVRGPLEELFEAGERILGKDKMLLAGREVRYLGAL